MRMRINRVRTGRWSGGKALMAHVVMALAAFMFAPYSSAQLSEAEHLSHHPEKGGGAGGTNGAVKPAGGGMMGPGGMMGGGMGGMMDGMMKKMGAPKPKDLYPSLMSLPDLPLEQRGEVQRQAHERMKAGAALMSQGLTALSQSAATDDFASMQKATAELREGLAQFESGLAAHRAIAEGKAPRNVALQWFKREMNLQPGSGGRHEHLILGLSVGHFWMMILLIGFAAVMVWMYFFKMRRAHQLLGNLAAGGTVAAPSTRRSREFNPAARFTWAWARSG